MKLRTDEQEDDGTVTLVTNEFVSVRTLVAWGIILVFRSDRPARTLGEVDESWGKVDRALTFVKRSELGLLLDMREARGRNDPEFETAVASYRKRTIQGFPRVAVVVRTTAGQLQVQRHIDEEGINTVRVFVDYGEALAWLSGARNPTLFS